MTQTSIGNFKIYTPDAFGLFANDSGGWSCSYDSSTGTLTVNNIIAPAQEYTVNKRDYTTPSGIWQAYDIDNWATTYLSSETILK
jgi:hypothetical protein